MMAPDWLRRSNEVMEKRLGGRGRRLRREAEEGGGRGEGGDEEGGVRRKASSKQINTNCSGWISTSHVVRSMRLLKKSTAF